MKNSILILNAFFWIIILFGCSDEAQTKVKKIDNYFVEARYTKDGYVDGEAKYYDEFHVLRSIITYERGIRNGKSINYYKNGAIKDSLNYSDDKILGFWWHLDSNGIVEYMSSYYYGVQVGAECLYDGGALKTFLFSDFNQTTLVKCDYEGVKVKDIKKFDMNPVIVDQIMDGKLMKKLFAYLPYIPHANQKFKIGISNAQGQDKELTYIAGNGVFIDTLLERPKEGWHYFIACHLKANNDSLNKMFITVVNDDLPK